MWINSTKPALEVSALSITPWPLGQLKAFVMRSNHGHLKIEDCAVDDPSDPLRRLFVFRHDAKQVQDGAALDRRNPRRQDRRLHPGAENKC